MLIVVSGLPATGKTTVAAAVAQRLEAVHLSVDAVEDGLLRAGLPRDWTTGVAAYEAVGAAAEQNLTLGRQVVVDAVNDSEAARDTWRRAASGVGASLRFFVLQSPDVSEHRRRLECRNRSLDNVPEPTWGQVRDRASHYEPWSDDCIELATDESVEAIAGRVEDALGRGPSTSG